MIYKNSLDGISPDMLKGFFVDWPNPPTPQTHLKLLKNSSKVVIAIDEIQIKSLDLLLRLVMAFYLPTFHFLKFYQNTKIKV